MLDVRSRSQQFRLGMNQMRGLMVHRVRTACSHEIFDERATHMRTPAERKLHLACDVGYQPDDPNGPHYSAWRVPIIHQDESKEFNQDTVFLHHSAIRVRIGFSHWVCADLLA